MSKYKIALMVATAGPEVLAEAVKVVRGRRSLQRHPEFRDYDFGGNRYLATGRFSDSALVNSPARRDSAGAIGHRT